MHSRILHQRIATHLIPWGVLSLFMVGLAGCLFSPSKSNSDFALSSRVWDGMTLDSAGQSIAVEGALRIHFTDAERVKIEVGNRQGSAPYSVSKSGRMSLGFPDDPLMLVSSDDYQKVDLRPWLPDFLSRVDRFKEQDRKLYLRATAYPDVLLSLAIGDTALAIGRENLQDTLVMVYPQPLDTPAVVVDTIPTIPTPVEPPALILMLPKDFPVYGGSVVPPQREASLRKAIKAWDEWKAANVKGYTFDYSEDCACLKVRSGQITVHEGKVVEYRPLKNIGEGPKLGELPTVETLFAQIGLLLTAPYKQGESMQIAFGPYGEPMQLVADMNVLSVMDDLSFVVSAFTPQTNETAGPLVPLDHLTGKVWTLSMIDPMDLGKVAPTIAQIQFSEDSTWRGHFLCNSYSGAFTPTLSGQYSLTLEPQTFLECGERPVIAQVSELLKNPVWMFPNANGDVLVASSDGSHMAILKVLLTFK
jgi:hypothetical protein